MPRTFYPTNATLGITLLKFSHAPPAQATKGQFPIEPGVDQHKLFKRFIQTPQGAQQVTVFNSSFQMPLSVGLK